jgi:hypothetical protein
VALVEPQAVQVSVEPAECLVATLEVEVVGRQTQPEAFPEMDYLDCSLAEAH